MIFVILFFTILTAARERYKEDMHNIVNEATEIATIIHSQFDIIFNMAIADAELFLLTNQESLVNGMRKLRGLPELPASNITGESIEEELKPNKAN